MEPHRTKAPFRGSFFFWHMPGWSISRWKRQKRAIISVFGGMYFYHSMFDLCHGQCAIWLKFGFRRNLPLTRHLRHTGAAVALAAKGAAGPTGGEVVAVVLGRDRFWEIALLLLLRFCLVNCFARLLAALAWLAALVPFPVWVLRLNRIPRLLSVWFIASRGHHFALGTGGLKLSLLVGGLGPVYSLPKHCFKPFRRLSAVGFVLGWHREPLLITTLQVP